MTPDDFGVSTLEKNIKAKDGVKWAYTLACFHSMRDAVTEVKKSVASIQKAAWLMAISCLSFLAALLVAGVWKALTGV